MVALDLVLSPISDFFDFLTKNGDFWKAVVVKAGLVRIISELVEYEIDEIGVLALFALLDLFDHFAQIPGSF